MFAQVVTLTCLVSLSYGGLYDGLEYSAPAVSYGHGPISAGLGAYTLAIPKAPAVYSAPAPIYHAPAPIYQSPVILYAHAPAIVAKPAIVKAVLPEPYDHNPQYSFSYGVNDPHTGDSKHAEETLINGVVHGSYSLAEPDGTIRKVSYTADKINGFNAVVEKKGLAVAAKVAVPAIANVYAPTLGYSHPYSYH